MVAVNNHIVIRDLIEKSGVCFGTSGMRGLVANMNDELCFAYTTAFLQEIVPDAKAIVLGHDLRPSSPRIAKACASAIQAKNVRIIFAGAVPTPALAWFAQQEKLPCIMITGSHIPFDRNGIKFYSSTGEISKNEELAITNAIVTNIASNVEPTLEIAPHAIESYLNRYLQFFPPNFLSGMRIGIYEHSSVARDLLKQLLTTFGAEIISLGRTDDFVPIDTEAVSLEDQELGQFWATKYQLDALVSTDGDADRPLIADEKGNWLRGDVVGLLCAKYLNANTVVTPITSTTAIELSGKFQNVIRTKVGSPYVIEEIEHALKNGLNRVIGFEANGGVLVGDVIKRNGNVLLPLATRDAVLPMLALLALAKEQKLSLSQLVNDLPCRFTVSDRIKNFPKEKSEELLKHVLFVQAKIENVLHNICGKIIKTDGTDGIRLTFSNGDIVHLRPSGNAPELRCYTEANTTEQATKLAKIALSQYVG